MDEDALALREFRQLIQTVASCEKNNRQRRCLFTAQVGRLARNQCRGRDDVRGEAAAPARDHFIAHIEIGDTIAERYDDSCAFKSEIVFTLILRRVKAERHHHVAKIQSGSAHFDRHLTSAWRSAFPGTRDNVTKQPGPRRLDVKRVPRGRQRAVFGLWQLMMRHAREPLDKACAVTQRDFLLRIRMEQLRNKRAHFVVATTVRVEIHHAAAQCGMLVLNHTAEAQQRRLHDGYRIHKFFAHGLCAAGEQPNRDR